jgi:hypothetical protein
MKNIDLGKSFGVLANVGVLLGIALLLVELKQNGDLLRAQIHQARSDSLESFQATLADSEYFAAAWRKFQNAGGPRDIAALDVLEDLEKARISQYLVGRLSGFDNLYYQYRNGFLDEEFYESRVVRAVRLMEPTLSELGLLDSPALTPSFLAEIERIRLDD